MKDHRQGRNVDEQTFKDTFGFRGVEFGNWVNNVERQEDVNYAFDGLMDLADTFEMDPKGIGLNGQLGLGFGSRGRGGRAAAHFEPSNNVINLTKTKGNGTVSHEWEHALEHALRREGNGARLTDDLRYALRMEIKVGTIESRFRSVLKGEAAVSDRNVPPKERALAYLRSGAWISDADYQTPFYSHAKAMDENRSEPYWSTPHELVARANEAYI